MALHVICTACHCVAHNRISAQSLELSRAILVLLNYRVMCHIILARLHWLGMSASGASSSVAGSPRAVAES
eukprot:4415493-Lingulodinium_polyedra.AAC.1